MKHLYLTIPALLLSFASFAFVGPITGSNHVCTGSTTTLSDTSAGGTWSSSAGAVASVGFSSGVVTGVSSGTATITYTVGINFVTFALTVNALPGLDTITGGGNYCPGSSGVHINLSGSDVGVNYQLYKGGVSTGPSLPGTGSGLDWGLFTVTGTYTVIATNSTTGCARNMYGSVTVGINPLPTAFTLYTPGSGVICTGSGGHLYLSGSQTVVRYQLFLGGTPLGIPLSGTGGILDFGSQTAAGSYTATGVDAATGCVNNMIGPVTLSLLPAPGPVFGPSSVCVGSSINLTDTSSGGTWSSSHTSVATVSSSGAVTGLAVGSTTISYTIPSGCSATTTISVINLVLPISGPTTICTGNPTTLSDASGGGTWVSSSPVVATIGSSSGIITGVSAGTTTINYTVGGTCGSVSTTVTVHTTPAAITGITSVCAGGTTSLGDTSPGGVWSSSNTTVGTVGTTGIVATLAGGSSTISYTIAGCASSVVLSVDPPPTITGPASVCVSSSINLTTVLAVSWASSNPFVGSVTSSGVVTGIAPGSAIITATALSTGCVSTHNVSVTSTCSGTPLAGVAHIASTLVCSNSPDLLYLTGTTSSCGVGFQWQYSTDSIFWTNLPGATTDSAYAYPQSQLYYRCKVTCFTSGLFAYSPGVRVSVYNNITSHGIINTPSFFCNGPDFHITTCGIQPATNVLSYYGDGTYDSTILSGTSADIYHTYAMPGTYTVKQILRNGLIPQDSVSYSFTYNYCRTLPVVFYFDTNSDCIDDDGDGYVFHPIKTEVDSNGIPIDTITAYNGFYYNALGGPGTVYRFKVIATDTGVHVTCPASGILYDTINAYVNTYSANYFGLNCTTSSSFDLGISADMICGRHTATGNIYVSNAYCAVENPVVTMTFSPDYVFGSSYPTPFSVVGNTVTWHLPPLSVYNSYYWSPYISYTLNVPGTFLTAGDTVQSSFTITPFGGDVYTPNNFYSMVDTIRASYDPNGITVTPGGHIISCTPLQYTIRFENTGNDTAYNIAVIDTLPDNVNPRSLQVVSATAVMNLAMSTYSGHTVVKFDFPHISLADSAHRNRCTGEVTFTVNAKAGLADGTVIQNHASIYFDDNQPVTTDTALNIIGISPIAGLDNLCNGSTIILTDASLNGAWSSANAYASVSGGLVTALTAGTDTINYTLSNSCTSETANKVITINPILTPSVSINTGTGLGDTICSGTLPTFTAVPVNGGSTPLYQWGVNGTPVSSGNTYSYVPVDADVINVELTSNALCTSPDTAVTSITLHVLPPNAPVDSMIATQGIFISTGTIDTFIAIITSRGGATYQWLLNGAPTGDTTDMYISHTLNDHDSVTCITTSTDQCKLSSFNSFIITVSNVGVQTLSTIGGLAVYPNPNNGEFTIRGSLSAPVDGSISVEITNMLGQVIYADKTVAINGAINEQLKVSNITNGMYVLILRSGSDSKMYHFVVEQ